MDIDELSNDQLKVGMHVTVVRGRGNDRSFQGDVMVIAAIDPPFVALAADGIFRRYPLSLDMREWKFKELSRDYVEAMRPIPDRDEQAKHATA